MLQGCALAAVSALGIAATWAVAFAIVTATSGVAVVAALVAAGIITAFAAPQLLRGIRECMRRRAR